MAFSMNQAVDDFRRALQAAYDAGFAAGEAAARKSLVEQVAAALNSPVVSTPQRVADSPKLAKTVDNLPPPLTGPGTVNVRSKIIDVLPSFGKMGGTVREIAASGGLNEYSTRGMLNRMRHEGLVTKIGGRDGRWLLLEGPPPPRSEKEHGAQPSPVSFPRSEPGELGEENPGGPPPGLSELLK